MFSLSHMVKAVAFSAVLLFLFSCASYNQQAAGYYQNLVQGDYAKASKNLDHNRLLQKRRNRLLYLLEKGRVEHLLQHFEISNRYFNEADLLMENIRTSARDVIAGTLINPMMQTYRGEDFEKYMVHYYKAMNYLQLNETDEALVEARRISLRTYAQDDAYNGNRYTEDAFSFILQALIYEKAKDYNNAFIACRNAADLYLKHGQTFYGTRMPEQLKKDVLRLAWKNGFTDELERYEQLLDLKFVGADADKEAELVLFWENGLAPVKREDHLVFSLGPDNNGHLFFRDSRGRFNIPFDHNNNTLAGKLSGMHTFHIALPRYEEQPPRFFSASVSTNGMAYTMEPAQNINQLAFATLEERWLKELTTTLTRMAVKKLAEEAAKPDEKEKDKNKKKKSEALSLGIKVFNMASEKADTRNWQSLPHSIFYTRIPVQKGANTFQINFGRGDHADQSREIQLQHTGGLQFYNISTR